jgi:mycofactocin precursor
MEESVVPTPRPESDGDVVLVEEELLVEDVSIDGMCGVY